jgi:hypothetical protein
VDGAVYLTYFLVVMGELERRIIKRGRKGRSMKKMCLLLYGATLCS